MVKSADTAHALRGIWSAARWHKNVPLALLVLGGALTPGGAVDGGALALSLLTMLSAAAFMTHLNIVTDAALDRSDKRHLIEWLARDQARTRRWMIGELAVTCVGIAILIAWGVALAALGLAVFTLATVLYSYNFLARDPVASRWKVSAVGHLAAVTSGYVALWVTGIGCSTLAAQAALVDYTPLFLAVALSEYALFLAESAVDDEAERRRGLATLAARLGRRGSSCVALAVAVGALLAVPLVHPEGGRATILAFVAAGLIRLLVVASLCCRLRATVDQRVRATLPDLCFFAARGLTVVMLALL